MKTSIEVSYYPLTADYLAPIGEFIERLNQYPKIEVRTSGMSTQVFGEFDEVMQALSQEIKSAFALPHSVFTLKVINADLREIPKAQ
ncbi:MAG: hypothetical protein HC819_13195 [Cyclobacteriaceae bacterium]|nr:hypothetical protein [Cyclobacteriaceae bacterium]